MSMEKSGIPPSQPPPAYNQQAPPAYPQGQPVPYAPGQPAPYGPGQPAPYPPGQPAQYAQGQPAAYPQGPPQPVAAQPATTTVVVQGGSGSCGQCGIGYRTENYTTCGIVLAICFFPLGLICCLLMKESKCSHCGHPM